MSHDQHQQQQTTASHSYSLRHQQSEMTSATFVARRPTSWSPYLWLLCACEGVKTFADPIVCRRSYCRELLHQSSLNWGV